MLKRLTTTVAALVLLAGCTETATQPDVVDSDYQRLTTAHGLLADGGKLSGPHYNLNLIGVDKGKDADMDGNNGHRIFLNLTGNSKIWLAEGEDFQVLDANGTDNDGAKFQLPNPDPNNDGITEYSVYARALGKPGGKADMKTCAYETGTTDLYCSVEVLELERKKGPSHFENVSKKLLYIYADLDGTGVQRYNLFNAALQDYFWNYDNQGLKLVQLRFYPHTTDVN